jgi:ornithine carbamoyltransferase
MQHLLTLDEITTAEMNSLFAQARLLKQKRKTHRLAPGRDASDSALAGCTIALLFEKPSLRTRVSFDIAMQELGGHCLYLSPQEVGLGQREAIADVARVLSAYVHGMVIRTFSHAVLEEFARYATVPVINGLTDTHHPCQGLTDVFTIAEQRGKTAGQVLAYFGDGNNVAHSLIQAAVKAGMHVRLATPAGFEPHAAIIAAAQKEALQTGATLTILHDPEEAACGADVLYTDVWASMGQEHEAARRRAIFLPYRLDTHLLSLASPDAIVMHPLPAHRGEEITDDVLDGPHSRVLIQAENRLHVQKAILRTLLAPATSRMVRSA